MKESSENPNDIQLDLKAVKANEDIKNLDEKILAQINIVKNGWKNIASNPKLSVDIPKRLSDFVIRSLQAKEERYILPEVEEYEKAEITKETIKLLRNLSFDLYAYNKTEGFVENLNKLVTEY
jgi:hypothetical protein